MNDNKKISAVALNFQCEFGLRIDLTLEEAKALEAITGHGLDSFLKAFYQHLGESYLQPYETGLKALYEKIQQELPQETRRIENAMQRIRPIMDELK